MTFVNVFQEVSVAGKNQTGTDAAKAAPANEAEWLPKIEQIQAPPELVEEMRAARARHREPPPKALRHSAQAVRELALTSAPNRELAQFLLRIPDDMRDALRNSAAANGRSMNSEILARLRDTFEWPRAEAERILAKSTAAVQTIAGLGDEAMSLAADFKSALEAERGLVAELQAKLDRLKSER
ncbi:MAG: Arc family DNA-binding protein [Beijerinckiaceae bacterium]|nr:Arc family DNA-binding protein [Beijerinckiaceae bacterium]